VHGRLRGAVVALLAATALPSAAPAETIPIAATIYPVYDIARNVAGGVADVVLVLPPGASPHTFEPAPSNVRALAGARVLFVVGHGLDHWASRLARGAGVSRVVPVDDGIALRRAAEGARGVDPHYWLAAANGKRIARTIAAELERLAPERRGEVRTALDRYLARLDAVDAEIRAILADLPSRRIATVHDAFHYFADAYGLEIAAVFEPFPGAEPGPRFVVEFQKAIAASDVRMLFIEPQLSDALRPIARDLGITLGVLDPLGGQPGRDGYAETLLFDARAVAAAARSR
jgi:ABC-type Zn uptake system ZnuABC Zn-binding protein ZnuA